MAVALEDTDAWQRFVEEYEPNETQGTRRGLTRQQYAEILNDQLHRSTFGCEGGSHSEGSERFQWSGLATDSRIVFWDLSGNGLGGENPCNK
ncbi:MAG: hypothetical protein CL731_05305 [Chloroflexi bacterium]|nr:hypothetical protein [Chloroflexota bacterium]